jgi:branched-chain amino acid aminotransferase
MGFQSQYIWMNGKLVDYQDATLHFLTPGLHYGIGVFEGIRCYSSDHGAAIFRLKDHLRRLLQSAAILGWREIPFSLEQLTDAVNAVVVANGFLDCYVRPLMYLAEGGWNLNIDTGKAHVGIAVWKWDAYLGKEAIERGVRANTSSFTRHHANASMSKAKICGNYVNSVLAKSESVRLGFDEAILLDTQGYVAECTGENLFMVRGKTLITPRVAEVLEGITRDTVIALAQDLGYTVDEQLISRDQLYTADEVLVCGTAAEIIGLREIDFRRIGSGLSGPVTRRLQRAFDDLVRGRHARSKDWLTHLPMAEGRAQLPPGAQDSPVRPGLA